MLMFYLVDKELILTTLYCTQTINPVVHNIELEPFLVSHNINGGHEMINGEKRK